MDSTRGKIRVAVAAFALTLAGAAAGTVTELPVGAPTPDFTLQTIDGREVSLRDEYGQPILLFFGDLSQAHSLSGLDEIAEVVERGEFGGAVKVFVIVTEVPEDAAAELPFPTLLDPTRATFADHGVISVLPCVVFLDRHGLLHHAMAGHGVGFADAVEDELAFLTGRITEADLRARRRGPESEDMAAATVQRRAALADQLRQRGLIEQARAAYEALLAETPDDVDALVGLAQIEMRQGGLDGALLHVRRALEINPDLPLGHKTLAHVLLLRGDTGGAAEAVEGFIAIAGEDVETHYLLGRVEEARGNEAAAAQHYRQACEALLADREWGIFSRR